MRGAAASYCAGRLRQDGNRVLEWWLGNVVGKGDRRGNLYSTKQRSDPKIDAALRCSTTPVANLRMADASLWGPLRR
jgi:phage terminase large subunit-like protein